MEKYNISYLKILLLKYKAMISGDDVDIDSINYLLSTLSIFKKSSITSLRNHFKEESISSEDFKKIYPIYRKLIKELQNDYLAIDDYKEAYISDEGTINFACDFYNSLDSESFNLFAEVFDKRKNHIKFMDESRLHTSFMVPIVNRNEAYICCVNKPTIEKLISFIHESQHAIAFKMNNDHIKNGNKALIREADALFKQLLACYFISKYNPQFSDDCNNSKNILHENIKEELYALYIKNQLIYLSNKKTFNNDKELLDYLVSHSRADINLVDYLCEESLFQMYYYPLAYMIAVELYEMYQVDPEKALYVCNEFIKMNNVDYYGELAKLDINIKKNILVYEKRLFTQ